MPPRMNKVALTVGRRGSGKTTQTLKVLEVFQKNFERTFIFDTLNHEDYMQYPIIGPEMIPAIKKGTVRVMVNQDTFPSIMAVIKDNCRNCGLIYEDAGKYITETIDQQFRNVILDTKQRNVDALILFHGFGDVPSKLYRDIDMLTIFKTNDSPKTYKYKIPQFQTVYNLHLEVMKSPVKWEHRTLMIN